MGRGNGTTATAGYAGARSRARTDPFKAKIDFKMFPKRGQAEKSNGFTIAKATVTEGDGRGSQLTLKGGYGPIAPGAEITVSEWRSDHDKWGEFRWVNASHTAEPVTREAVEGYLAHLPGVGEGLAREIVNQLGVDCLEKIDQDPGILLGIKTASGHSARTNLEELSEAWESMRRDRKAVITLTSMGLKDNAARKAIAYFGPKRALEKVNDDPYTLCLVPGIGFRQADAVARKQGLRWESAQRIGAGCEHFLNEGAKSGHICYSESELLSSAPQILQVSGWRPTEEMVRAGIKQMEDDGRIWRDGDKLYSTQHYLLETLLMNHLEKRLSATGFEAPEDLRKPEDSPATDEQWKAVENAFVERLSILRGSAGTGKTTALRAMLDALDHYGQSYVCMAPTGKAAKRMEESTGREAMTIHRGLKLGVADDDNPESRFVPSPISSSVDVVVVDEASMIDMKLAESVFRATSENTRVVLVGDPDQLPAIGLGSVMHDLIESERVPTTHLTKIFRQAEGSLLLVNANRIRQGEEPYWTAEEAEADLGHPVRRDFEFVEADSASSSEQIVCELSEKMAAELGVGEDELFVTAATKAGVGGVQSLNQKLRLQRNPAGARVIEGEWQLNEGDLVMNTKNRYAKSAGDPEVMNGDSGRLVEWDPEEKTAWVKFDSDSAGDAPVPFRGSEIEKLIPAFAATTHKLQGSEAPGVITPVNATGLAGTAHRMVTRNLLYTAITRAKEKCAVVGSKSAIRDAVSRDGSKRNTQLDLKVGALLPRLRTRQESLRLNRGWKIERDESSTADMEDLDVLLGL